MLAAVRRTQAWIGVVAAMLGALLGLGATCEPGAVRVTNRPPDPALVDADGEVDGDGLDALVAAVEAERGLGFVRAPSLQLLEPGDPRARALRDRMRALAACPAADDEPPSEPPAPGSCFPEPSASWIACVTPPDVEQARRALRRQLDAQNYPRLADAAPTLRGDPGVVIRSLLAASAAGAPAGVESDQALDLLTLPAIELEKAEAGFDGCEAMAAHFFSTQSDREAPLRSPPQSTKQMISPSRYRARERPALLEGAPPRIEGCTVARDESVGVAQLLVALLAKGGSVAGPTLAAWSGDRGVVFACDDDRSRWIYVAELADAAGAAALARAVGPMLPAVFAGRSDARAVERRVVVVSEGVAAGGAVAWARALESRPMRGIAGLD